MGVNLVSIGKVKIDYKNYLGKDLYSDGEIEAELLNAVKNGVEDNILKTSKEWGILYHLSDIRENVIEWLDIAENAEVLEIGAGCGAITGILAKKAAKVTCVELSERRSLINAYRHKEYNNVEIKLGNFMDVESSLGKYDYVTLIGVLEYSKLYIDCDEPYIEMLKIAKKHLNENGRLIIAIENKMGLKYLNGAPEDHNGKMYSGLNDYVEDDSTRTFSSSELRKMLNKAGFEDVNIYCASPDYKLPTIINAYDYRMEPGTIRTYKKVFNNTRFYNYMEDVVSDQLCNDGMFSYMANSYVIVTGSYKDELLYAKYNRERKKEYRIATYIVNINDKKEVIKSPLTSDAEKHILTIKSNETSWRGMLPNVKVLSGKIEGTQYVSGYIEGISLAESLYHLRTNVNLFIKKVDEFNKKYLTPNKKALHKFVMSEEFKTIFGDCDCDDYSMKSSNVDAVFTNLKIDISGEVYAYDFEWVFNFDIPYRYLIWRADKEVYNNYMAYLKSKINLNDYLLKLGFKQDEIERFKIYENNFGKYVFGEKYEEIYTSRYMKPVIMQNVRMS